MIEVLEPIIRDDITYPININGNIHNFKIKYNNFEGNVNDHIDGVVVMLVPIAICNKWKITSKLPIDKKLYDNLLNIPFIYKKYHHKHTFLLGHITKEDLQLELDLPTIIRNDTNTINITPISLGIDSMHTIETNQDEISHFIYINHLDNSTNIKNFNQMIGLTAEKYNKKLIIADSNFLKITQNLKIPGTNYGCFLGDPVLFASCYPLGIKTLFLSGFGGNIPCIMGQHSEVNQFFNSNVIKSIQNETLRIKKIKYLIEKIPDFLNILRVCNDNIKNNNKKILNCSQCGKCTRTLCYIYMLGYYDKAITFERPDCNFLDYYIENFFNSPNKTLATTFYDKIFSNLVKIYKEDDGLKNIDKYELIFVGDDNIIVRK